MSSHKSALKGVKEKTNNELLVDQMPNLPKPMTFWIQAAILLVVSFLIYSASIPFNYVLDDKIVITDNAYTKKGISGLKEIFTTESFTGYFGEKKELVQGNRYRPLSIATFAVEYELNNGLNPKMSHIINIFLYGLTCIILLLVLYQFIGNQNNKWYWSIPFLASFLFLVHPIHTEAVANIKGRDEIMSLMFSLLMLYGSMKYLDFGKIKWLLFSLLSYFLGLLSKENAITFLAIIPLTAYFFRKQLSPRIGKTMFWLGITTIIYLMLRFSTAGIPKFSQEISDLMNNPFLGMTPIEKMGSILYTLGKYLVLMIWPYPLSHDYYPYAIPKTSLFSIIPLISLLAYAGLIIIGIKQFKSKSIFVYSIWFYLITLSIVSNIVINVGTFMNERFIFMASLGFCLAVAHLFYSYGAKLLGKNGLVISTALFFIIAVIFGTLSFLRVPVWKDALSLNKAAVEVSGGSARANSFMSTAVFEEYKVTTDKAKQEELLDQTEYYAKKAIEIFPDYNNANLMLIGAVTERFKMNHDIQYYTENMKPIIIRRPDIPFIVEFSTYLKDKGYGEALYPFYIDVGKSLLKLNDKRKGWSIQYLQYAYEINPNNKDLVLTLSKAYELAGNTSRAKLLFDAAQQMQ
ncbi:MAG: tetratricopeptide repeat protein [Lewinellaceae bacterium]|nr:tetratricopeptide repeat protein [Lewinellaceae bacterium]